MNQVAERFLSIAILGGGVAPQLAWAGVEFDPFYQYPQPYYFSSTNARAYHHASVTPPSLGIARTELYVGGKLVAEEDYPVIGPLYMYEAEHSVMFDSSVFNDGDEVEVELKVWTNDGGPFVDSWAAPVKNRASLYGRFDLDVSPLYYNSGTQQYAFGSNGSKGMPAAIDHISAMNYELILQCYYFYCTKEDLFAGVEDSNSLYVHTNGNVYGGQAFIWTDSNDYWKYYPFTPENDMENIFAMYVPQGAPYADTVFPSRVTGNGDFLPPINSTGNPPVNIAYLDACLSGSVSDFGQALLFPFGNIYVGTPEFPENQAVAGYDIFVQLDQAEACGEAFWGALEQGLTIVQARHEAWEAYEGLNKPGQETDFLKIWGDHYARMKTVYTGSNFQLNYPAWYRSI